ncbi:COMM domain-containing protein 6 [Rhinatrema bivittatum]|uniref:COMM domain-containing protein 6 n=1 Tax=Rhinatrema bivittatum TaxID=194408 RepID=UPI00112EB0CF|nr:COMM domain-containing protein 6 [Rhinatrema bivittatum]
MAASGARAGVFGRSLAALDFDNLFAVIKTIPPDLFAELCQQVIQYLQCQIAGVNTAELCQKFQTAGTEVSLEELRKIVNALIWLFSTAAQNNLSDDELSDSLSSVCNALPKQILQVIRHVWSQHGQSVSTSENPKNMVTVGQLVDFQWKLGMAVSSDTCRSLNYPYVTVMLRVADYSGQTVSKSFEMSIPQFQNFFRQFKEMAAVLESV